MNGLEGKRVLVTGGDSGIGQAIAVRFGREHASVAINYRRNETAAEETARLVQEELDRCMSEISGYGATAMLVRRTSRRKPTSRA